MLYIDIPIDKRLKIINFNKNYCDLYVKPKLDAFKSDIKELEKLMPQHKVMINGLILFIEDLVEIFHTLVIGSYEELVKLVIYNNNNAKQASLIEKFENAKNAYAIIIKLIANVSQKYENQLEKQLLKIFDYDTFSSNKVFILSEGYHKINQYLKDDLYKELGALRSKKDEKSKKEKKEIYIKILNKLLNLNDTAIKKNSRVIHNKISDLNIKKEIRLDSFFKWLKKLRDTIEEDEAFQWSVYKLVREIGINVCPYCDRQFITVLEANKKSRPQLDHFMPKNKLPFLAISLFNLIPSCGVCNSSIKTSVNFIPLTQKEYLLFNDKDVDVPYTIISPYSKLMKKYIKEKLFKFDILLEKDYIKVHRLKVKYSNDLEKNVIRLLNNFCILDIYNQSHQKDLEDIYIKRNLINSDYKIHMSNYIQNKFKLSEEYSKGLVNRVLLGNDFNLNNNRRPLDKLTYDLLMED